jgi:L-alanine-DL-glutamate epimerase-like enolase superfamily enzyme
MRITKLESFHADGAWRPFSFLKVTTDEGLIGWSEYACGPWAATLPALIGALGRHVIGRDPRHYAVLRRELTAMTLFAAGGLNCQAAAAIENACIDIAAKAAGLSVAQLFGGSLRNDVALYWTHCGSFRARDPELFERLSGRERLSNLDAMQRLGREVTARGFSAAKTNPIEFHSEEASLLNPGFVPSGLDHAGNLEAQTLTAIEAQIEAFRDGAGPRTDLMLDVNFAYSPLSLQRLESRLARFGLRWLEYDHSLPAALAELRRGSATPLASLETIHESRNYKPFLEAGSVDVAIIDVLWNGMAESVRTAHLCELNAVTVAPHNFYGPLADLMAAQFCAVVPNLEIMEFEADDVPWKYDLLTRPPNISRGRMTIPEEPGWGADIDEDCLAEHQWHGAI